MIAKLLSPAEAAEILGVCTRTLRAHVDAGELAYVNTGCGTKREHRMFRPADVEAFIEARTRCKPVRPVQTSRIRVQDRGYVYDFTKTMPAHLKLTNRRRPP